MSTAKRLSSVLAVLLCALAAGARAQTTSVEVALDGDRARFNAQGEALRVQVEIYAPGGELLYAGEAAAGGAVEWSLRDKAGRRVADGVYLAAVTVTDSAGKETKRVEQVVVNSDAQAFAAVSPANAPNPVPAAPSDISGEGTNGKIAKFTGTYAIGASVIAESAGKVGVGTTAAPTATLQINGAQPAAQPGTGTEATPLLQTTGGKGGNSTTAGEIAGKGASISLLGGNGGNTISGSTNGSGGSITLQGGSVGTGGSGGTPGYVLLAPTVGNVGIGTNAPTSKLTVTGAAAGTNLVHVENTSIVANSVGVYGKSARWSGVLGRSDSSSSAGVRGESGGPGVFGTSTGAGGASAGVSGLCNNCPGVRGQSTSSYGVHGKSTHNIGVMGESSGSHPGVFGKSESGIGVFGTSVNSYAGYFDGTVAVEGTVEVGGTVVFGSNTRQMLHLYLPYYGIGVQNSTLYFRTNSGFGWYKGGLHNDTANSPGTGGTRLMKLDSVGNLTATSFNPTSDRNAKSNFSAVSPRAILDKLRSLPIQTWSYKVDDDAVKHIGPVAQDFRAAFNLGADDKTISTVDADGVALAAIQGLYQLTVEQNRELTRQVAELRSQVIELQQAVKSRGRRSAYGRRQRR